METTVQTVEMMDDFEKKHLLHELRTTKRYQVENNRILEDVSKTYHAKIDEILLSALFITLNQISQENDFLIELENHGRDFFDLQIDISNTVGWFGSIYSFRLKSQEGS